MTKLWKKPSVLCLLLAFVLFAGTLAACDPKEEEPETLVYSVTVINDAEAPVSGVKVKFGNFTQTTDADGKASMELIKGDYTISLSGLPEGYTYSQDIKLTPENYAVIATLVKGEGTPPPVVPVDPNAPREYRVTVLYPNGTPVTGVSIQFCTDTTCLPKFIDVNAQGTASNTLKPNNYHIIIHNVPEGYTYPQDASGYYTGETFSATKTTMTVTLVSTTVPDDTPDGPPKATGSVTEAKATGTYSVTLNEKNSYATVNFAPSLPGKYEITSLTSDYDPMVGYYAFQYNTANWASLGDADKNDDISGSDKNFKYAVKIYADTIYDSVGKPTNAFWQFRIFLKDKKTDGSDVNFPATFQVKIERTGDANRRVNQTKDATLTATLSPFEEANGRTAKSVAMDGSAVLAFNETDGFYHLGTENGPVVMVLLTKPCSQYIDRALSELDELVKDNGGDSSIYSCDETPEADKDDEQKPLLFVDYRLILRGRKAYIENGVIPEATEDEYYTKYVNADGYYGLTKDLEKFLKGYISKQWSYIKNYAPGNAKQENLWLFACYYYEEPAAAIS